jgi:hypothetical protein
MAAGVPVISTSLGAEGIAAEPGVDFLCANTAGDFASAMRGLVGTPAIAMALAARGGVVARRYDWSSIGKPLYELHKRLAEPRTMRVSAASATSGR